MEAIIAISLSQMCSTFTDVFYVPGGSWRRWIFFIKPTYLMMLSDYKIFLLQSSLISSPDQKLQSPVGCIYLDTFLLVNFPYTSILLLFSFTKILLCPVVPLSFPPHSSSSQIGRVLHLISFFMPLHIPLEG